MLVKEVKNIISTKIFVHCTDAILSIILDKPRIDIKDGVLVLQHDGHTNIYKYNEL